MRLEWDKDGGGWERVGEDEKGMGEIRKRMEGDWRERVGGIRSLPLCLSLSLTCVRLHHHRGVWRRLILGGERHLAP